MSDIQTLIERNQSFAGKGLHHDLGMMPRFKTIVLTCMDARIDPAHFLQLDLGDAVVLRNAGGRVTPAIIEDVALLAGFAAVATGNPVPLHLAVIHHTQCGLERLADPQARRHFAGKSGLDEPTLHRMGIHNHDQAMRDDLEKIRASQTIPDTVTVTGYLYDPVTGLMKNHTPVAA